MGNFFRDSMNRWGSTLRLSVARRRDDDEVRKDIAALHPYDVGIPLTRVGRDGDGGYLLPDDLDGIAACMSPGVGGSSDFELALDRRGIPCFLADGSVDAPPPSARHLSFAKKFIGPTQDECHVTIEQWMRQHPVSLSGDCILQMDIEGAEYAVLLACPRSVLRRFRIIAIELHFMDALSHPVAGPLMGAAFRILAEDFVPVHLHANNVARPLRIGSINYPRLLEVTWLRRDRCLRLDPRAPGCHPLDRDNTAARPSVILSPEWFAAPAGDGRPEGVPMVRPQAPRRVPPARA